MLPSRKGASKLEPYTDEILELREKHSLEVIREYLEEKYDIEITRSAINAFVKRRQKRLVNHSSMPPTPLAPSEEPNKAPAAVHRGHVAEQLPSYTPDRVEKPAVVDVWAGKVTL
ncbi:hypothetical protein E4188_24000 (plasmid) [Aeromonas media]|uniref:Clr5 domain-containing protein n=2 Tax=Aeromonas TaxID=642 RepID=A0ABX6P0D8_AERME|nr:MULTISPECIES: hypothetical protein [Aeromonas]ASI21416.1 hypothetical protein CE456_00805 [Aeromonas salmonicida]QJT41556.1 hypothetical protein E4188_24000 [Aeromonas media]QLI59230.1 hypothetical protein C0708_23130 [Aeromonas caviae]QLI60271.1 hypothetical protein C1C91_22780 [Aeromonas caviae]HDN9374618.1 hypothetical protein [Aeromonas salmonicida]